MNQEFNSQKLKEMLSDKATMQLVGVAIIAIIYFFFLILPKAKTVFKGFGQANQMRANIVTTEASWSNRANIERDIAQSNERINFYEKELPGEKEIPAVLRYLSDSARKLNVKITEIKPVGLDEVEGQESPIYTGVPISLKAECGFHELGRFISELESADRFMKISDIKIVANPNDLEQHYVRMMVIAYVMRK